jgi:hypothetical protein
MLNIQDHYPPEAPLLAEKALWVWYTKKGLADEKLDEKVVAVMTTQFPGWRRHP